MNTSLWVNLSFYFSSIKEKSRIGGHLVSIYMFPYISEFTHSLTHISYLLLRVPWTARRSNPPILKEINPEYSLKGLMLKLKLQYFGHLMWRAESLKKTLMLGKIEGKRRGWQRMRWLDSITDSMDMSLSKL